MSDNPNLAYDESSIKSLDLITHMRKKSAMYMGDTKGLAGHIHLIKEVIDNSADEASVLRNQLNQINVTIIFPKSGGYQVIVADNGRGIPLGKLKDCLANPLTSGKWESDSYEGSSGTHGIGAKGTMTLSQYFCGVASRSDRGQAIVYVEDLKIVRSEIDESQRPSYSGTTVFYEPDPKWIKGEDQFVSEGILALSDIIAFISSTLPNTTIGLYVSNKRVPRNLFVRPIAEVDVALRSWEYHTEVLKTNPNFTTIDLLKQINKLPPQEIWSIDINKPFASEGDGDRLGYDIHVFLATDEVRDYRDSMLISSVNRIPINTPDNYNVSAVIKVFKEKLSPFITDHQIKSYFENLYRLPIYMCILISFKDAAYLTQLKTGFKDTDFLDVFNPDVRKRLRKYDQSFWQSLYDLLSEHIEQSFHKYFNRGNVSTSLKNVGFSLNNPRGYKACRSNDPNERELFLVEGESAGGQVEIARNPEFQAVFVMKGKPLNCMRSSDMEIRNDLLNHDLMTVLGLKFGQHDLTGLNFKKIFILTDADDHGNHIQALTVGNLYVLNPNLIIDGHVGIVNPPLYMIKGGNAVAYLRDERALLDTYVESVYRKALKITINDEPLTGENFRVFCYLIDRIGTVIDMVANRLSVDGGILESLAHCVDYIESKPINTDAICTLLNLTRVEYDSQTFSLILIYKEVEVFVPLDHLATAIRASVIPELEKIKWKDIDIKVTTLLSGTYRNESVSAYMLYQIFKLVSSIFTTTRFKGLGEMKPKDLSQSALDPETRVIFTITSIGDINTIKAMLEEDSSARKLLLE